VHIMTSINPTGSQQC